MRALLQRAAAASVSIDGEPTASIGSGLVVLLGIARGDDEADAEYLVGKTVNLRIFSDESGHFNRSALDAGAELLVVSQFTLYAATRKGRRPDFTAAAPPKQAEPLYERTVELFRETGLQGGYRKFRRADDGQHPEPRAGDHYAGQRRQV